MMKSGKVIVGVVHREKGKFSATTELFEIDDSPKVEIICTVCKRNFQIVLELKSKSWDEGTHHTLFIAPVL